MDGNSDRINIGGCPGRDLIAERIRSLCFQGEVMAIIDIEGVKHEVHDDVAELIRLLSDEEESLYFEELDEGIGLVVCGKIPSPHFFNQ